MPQIPGRPAELPDFQKPPLIETVFSIQFEPLAALATPHVGLLWERFKEFHEIEEHPPLAPVTETFGPPMPARIEVLVGEKPPLRRVWFLNENKTELIQLQADRFIHNWRRREGFDPYPHYEHIRDRFRGEVDTLELFLGEYALGKISVNQCELTYLNHIERSGAWKSHSELENAIKTWAPWPDGTFLPEPEDIGVHMRFLIRESGSRLLGRLHVTLQPAWKKEDNSPILVLNMTARGAPIGNGPDGAFSFFDVAREWIVKGFADLTTTEMQTAWGRRNG